MQLPLEVCQQFGQFAYQDEQQGIEAIAAIQDFIEPYHAYSISNNDSQAKTVTIERDQAGIVTASKSVKPLPNMQINLKALITDAQERTKEATNITTIVVGGVFSDWLMKVGAALYLIQFGMGLTTVKLKSEQAEVLVALHHLCRGELYLEIPFSALQTKMRENYHFSLSVEELDQILRALRKLRCISIHQNSLYLTETVVLKES
jgi:hypothetical protein